MSNTFGVFHYVGPIGTLHGRKRRPLQVRIVRTPGIGSRRTRNGLHRIAIWQHYRFTLLQIRPRLCVLLCDLLSLLLCLTIMSNTPPETRKWRAFLGHDGVLIPIYPTNWIVVQYEGSAGKNWLLKNKAHLSEVYLGKAFSGKVYLGKVYFKIRIQPSPSATTKLTTSLTFVFTVNGGHHINDCMSVNNEPARVCFTWNS